MLPWSQKDELSPIYDAEGAVVSFTAEGPRIVAAVNNADRAAYLLEAMALAVVKATGPAASAVGTIELIALAPAAQAMAKTLRGVK